MRIAVACDLAAIFRALGGFPAAAAAAVRSLFQSLQLLPACAPGELEDEMNAGRTRADRGQLRTNKPRQSKRAWALASILRPAPSGFPTRNFKPWRCCKEGQGVIVKDQADSKIHVQMQADSCIESSKSVRVHAQSELCKVLAVPPEAHWKVLIAPSW